MPIYNKKPHLERSINSVLNQNFYDFELILINDSSTDGSDNEILKFKDSRIKILNREIPGPGGYAARNLGIRNSKGKYITFIDADDFWFTTHLESYFNTIRKSDFEIEFISCGWKRISEENESYNPFFLENKDKKLIKIDKKKYFELSIEDKIPVWTSVVCFKNTSELNKNLFPISEKIRRGGDLIAWLRLIHFFNNLHWVNHVGAVYFQDSVNMVTKSHSGNFEILSKKIFKEFSYRNTNLENKILAKFFNKQILTVWFRLKSTINSKKKYNIKNRLYWKYDFKSSLKVFLITSLPFSLILKLKNYK
nr:glycosyltransferase family 2 protein [Marivirga aurantiaca]